MFRPLDALTGLGLRSLRSRERQAAANSQDIDKFPLHKGSRQITMWSSRRKSQQTWTTASAWSSLRPRKASAGFYPMARTMGRKALPRNSPHPVNHIEQAGNVTIF
jgi:hypothetical protein